MDRREEVGYEEYEDGCSWSYRGGWGYLVCVGGMRGEVDSGWLVEGYAFCGVSRNSSFLKGREI